MCVEALGVEDSSVRLSTVKSMRSPDSPTDVLCSRQEEMSIKRCKLEREGFVISLMCRCIIMRVITCRKALYFHLLLCESLQVGSECRRRV